MNELLKELREYIDKLENREYKCRGDTEMFRDGVEHGFRIVSDELDSMLRQIENDSGSHWWKNT